MDYGIRPFHDGVALGSNVEVTVVGNRTTVTDEKGVAWFNFYLPVVDKEGGMAFVSSDEMQRVRVMVEWDGGASGPVADIWPGITDLEV